MHTMSSSPAPSGKPRAAAPQGADALRQLRDHLEARIIGQQALVQRLLMALLADGHLLVEGAPGLAKTRSIRCLAEALEGDFQRIQFTPDLLPSDITGSDVYRPQQGVFEFQPGPVFHNFILADEINRAPAKVQSALLEAMSERQVSVGNNSRPLPEPFLVMATQNPLEQEGTYALPEAQLDRFLMHVCVGWPDADSEHRILQLARAESAEPQEPPRELGRRDLLDARAAVRDVHLGEAVEQYLVQLVMASRRPADYDSSLGDALEVGASPRASIAMDRCARALAWLDGRDFVSPDDIRAVAPDCLRHRLVLSVDAEADGHSAGSIIDRLLACVPSL